MERATLPSLTRGLVKMDVMSIIYLINSIIRSMGNLQLLSAVFLIATILKVIGDKVGVKDDSSN